MQQSTAPARPRTKPAPASELRREAESGRSRRWRLRLPWSQAATRSTRRECSRDRRRTRRYGHRRGSTPRYATGAASVEVGAEACERVRVLIGGRVGVRVIVAGDLVSARQAQLRPPIGGIDPSASSDAGGRALRPPPTASPSRVASLPCWLRCGRSRWRRQAPRRRRLHRGPGPPVRRDVAAVRLQQGEEDDDHEYGDDRRLNRDYGCPAPAHPSPRLNETRCIGVHPRRLV